MVWFVVWFVSLQMSASLLPDDLSIPYFGLSQQHNQQIMTIFPHNESNGQTDVDQGKCLYTTYGGKTVEEISQLISSEMVQKSFDVQGSFTRLRKNLELKLQSNLPFNILYLGGSVCVGHGCHLCKSSGNSFQVNEASFHCSWTHRLTRYVEFLIEQIRSKSQSPPSRHSLVSSRYCCKSATSSNMGLDILITKSYHSLLCQLSNSKPASGDWEPDLIFWDYSVNDLSSRVSLCLLNLSDSLQWFRNRSRRDVFEGLVLKALNLTSAPQLIVFESLNRRLDLKPSDMKHMDESREDRTVTSRRYNIPMVNYLSALGLEQAPPLTPYYAQLESDRHPGWPTHMLWSQLMSEVIVFGLRQSQSRDSALPVLLDPISVNSTKHSLCLQVRTTRSSPFPSSPLTVSFSCLSIFRDTPLISTLKTVLSSPTKARSVTMTRHRRRKSGIGPFVEI
jgi:hypothetical protein